MEKFTLYLGAAAIFAAGILHLAKFLIIEGHDFWLFLLSLRW